MGRFRSPKSQARHAVRQELAIGKPRHGKKTNDSKIHSLGTARTYIESLSCLSKYILDNRLDPLGKGLASLTMKLAIQYLEYRSEFVGQKTLDKDRQAIQSILGQKIEVIKSEHEQILKSRSYTQEQILLIVESQTSKHSLSTLICRDAGLRAVELHTIAPIYILKPSSHRLWTDDRFLGRRDVSLFTVIGKGGLAREVALSSELAERLETLRLAEPRIVTDRDIYYTKYYDVGGGHQWSNSFTKASKRALGWTCGGHGIRHTYAQSRMIELQTLGINFEDSMGIVAQEMGHFRKDITGMYLR